MLIIIILTMANGYHIRQYTKRSRLMGPYHPQYMVFQVTLDVLYPAS